MTVSTPPRFELMYTGREIFRKDGKPDYEEFRPLEGDYATVAARAVELNRPQIKNGRISRLFFPEIKKEADDD